MRPCQQRPARGLTPLGKIFIAFASSWHSPNGSESDVQHVDGRPGHAADGDPEHDGLRGMPSAVDQLVSTDEGAVMLKRLAGAWYQSRTHRVHDVRETRGSHEDADDTAGEEQCRDEDDGRLVVQPRPCP